VHESARKINNFARAALECCLNVVTWLSPEEGVVTNAVDGTRECTSLVATTLSFRGYSLRNNATHVPGDVRLSAMRNVLTAALLQATDERPPPAELEVSTARSDGGLQVRLQLRSVEGEAGTDAVRCYRSLLWTDVEALAAAEDTQVSRPADGEIVITFPWVRAAAA
jgi:hypothetical protein